MVEVYKVICIHCNLEIESTPNDSITIKNSVKIRTQGGRRDTRQHFSDRTSCPEEMQEVAQIKLPSKLQYASS